MPVRKLQMILASMLLAAACSRARVESMQAMNEGVVLAQEKRYPEAAKLLEKALVIDETNVQAMWNLATVYGAMSDSRKAADVLRKAIAHEPKAGKLHAKLGAILVEDKDWANAKAALEKAIEHSPKNGIAHYRLGLVSERLVEPQRALEMYTKAIELDPYLVQAYAALGRLYADLKYEQPAAQVLAEGLKVARKDSEEEAQLHQLLGTVKQQQGQYEAAISEFQRALSISPGLRDAQFSLGWTYLLAKQNDKAKEALDQFVKAGVEPGKEHYVNAAREMLGQLSEQDAAATAPQAPAGK